MRNMIHIGKLYLIKTDEAVRLNSDIKMQFGNDTYERTFFYEVEKRWGKYLVTEISDAFVIAFLELAMEKDADIYFDTPASEDLIYNLQTYMIPILAYNIKELSIVNLYGDITNMKIDTEGVVGTGFSGGVDSFYSVLSHRNIRFKSKEVTHVLLGVNGAALSGINEELDKFWFEGEKERFEPITKELGVELIAVNSNISLLNDYKKYLLGGDFIVTSSFVHALCKLFGLYYWASAVRANEFEFNKDDGNLMELFAVPLASTSGLIFVLDGDQVSRIEKVEFIADNKVVQKSITVCGELENCGGCDKCLRTMGELYALGKLDKFKLRFPVEQYLAHPARYLAREIGLDAQHSLYVKEIFSKMKENGIHIPFVTYIKGYLIYKPFHYFRPRLKGNKFLEFIYHRMGVYKLFGGMIIER